MTTEQTKAFILAGKAIFTVSNGKPAPDARDYTFKVSKKAARDGNGDVFFVALLTGSDNESDYTYLGLLDAATGRVKVTAKSTFLPTSAPVVAVGWALGHIWAGRELPHGASLVHAGRCGKCARTLTVPESIESGLGPECSGLGYTKARNERKPRTRKAPKPTFEQLRAQAAASFTADGLGLPATPKVDTTPTLGNSEELAIIAEQLAAERDADRATDLDLSDVEGFDVDALAHEIGSWPTSALDINGEDSVDRAERALGVQ